VNSVCYGNSVSCGNSVVKLPKIGIVLGLVSFLPLDFQCTLRRMVHQNYSGDYVGEVDVFNHLCGNQGACPCGEIGVG